MSEAVKIADDIILLENSSDSEGFDDYDGHFDNPTETSEPPPKLVKPMNGLNNNDDFIALSDTSEEETTKEADNSKNDALTKLDEGSENVTTDYPWIINHDHSKQREIADWLTLEMKDFIQYISPNKTEIKMRNETIGKLRDAVRTLWPGTDLNVFGSYATDLYLPGSDIDCVVNSENQDKDNRVSLYELATYLKHKKLATEVEVIAKARVPIIKFVEPESRIHIDVSFERTNGLEAAKLIREWLRTTPGLRELVLVVKQFLHARRLNNVHTGGLGGFSIICLVLSFLRTHPRIVTNEIDAKENLGVLLIDFFELYGKNFGYDDVAISMLNGEPSYLPKVEWRDLQSMRTSFALCIQDPGDASNNISRGSFNVRDIKKAFAGAFDLLTNRCFELDLATFKDRRGKSILGNVIKYRGKQRDFKDERNLIQNKAIVENEDYHKRRSRIMYEKDTTEQEDEDNEHTDNKDEPLKKKRKKDKPKKGKKKKDKSKKKKKLSTSADDDNEDSYNPLAI